jgi:hypothetical protein
MGQSLLDFLANTLPQKAGFSWRARTTQFLAAQHCGASMSQHAK